MVWWKTRRQLLVSYTGIKQGRTAHGWVVLEDCDPLTTADDIQELVDKIETECGYETGTLALISFQRLER